jgi:PAS domain S-box-containing protein
VVSVFVVGWALFYGQLLEVVPVARDNLVRGMTDAVVTLDAENRVVDANPAARELCGVDEGYVGTHGEEFFAEFPSLIERFGDVTEAKTEVSVEADGERRHFDLRITPVDGGRPAESGRLIVLREITERKRREQALREKNERLDQFANFVSHDLRNPLQVAAGHAALARESGDDEHIERVEGSLARMDEMIENLRTLTHADEDHVETTRLELEAAATDAWAGVDAAEARLVVETTCQIVADREFLLHTLENLFRNAVEHASEAATVTVGCLDEGFYVADDGPGIPPEERDRVLEYGYTNSQDGTGIGLAIVRTVAEAHGWEITVTESDSGGARFEFAGPSAPAGEPSPTGQQTT